MTLNHPNLNFLRSAVQQQYGFKVRNVFFRPTRYTHHVLASSPHHDPYATPSRRPATQHGISPLFPSPSLALFSLTLTLSVHLSPSPRLPLRPARLQRGQLPLRAPPPAPLSSPAALPLAVSIRGAPAPRRTPMRLTPPSRTGDNRTVNVKPPAAASWSRRRMCAGEEQPISSKPTTGTAPAPSIITRYLSNYDSLRI